MKLFSGQLANVIEWNESRDDVLVWMWRNKEIKKGSRLIIRPGQDAIFLYNGKIEGIFKDEGNYEIESDIIPVLTSLKGFKFGFNTPLRAEVVFINTKEFLVRWGTKNPINIPTARLKGGLPIRCFGTFSVRIDDHTVLIDKIAGIKQQFTVEDVKDRTLSMLDSLLMRWITREGKDLFNLQMNTVEIENGICEDLDKELLKIGLTVTHFSIASFSYPENIQMMIEKTASYDMVDDLERYQKVSLIDAMSIKENDTFSQGGQNIASLVLGVEMMKQMTQALNTPIQSQTRNKKETHDLKLHCPNCQSLLVETAKFCVACGEKVLPQQMRPTTFCSECGCILEKDAKFCSECGTKVVR